MFFPFNVILQSNSICCCFVVRSFEVWIPVCAVLVLILYCLHITQLWIQPYIICIMGIKIFECPNDSWYWCVCIHYCITSHLNIVLRSFCLSAICSWEDSLNADLLQPNLLPVSAPHLDVCPVGKVKIVSDYWLVHYSFVCMLYENCLTK